MLKSRRRFMALVGGLVAAPQTAAKAAAQGMGLTTQTGLAAVQIAGEVGAPMATGPKKWALKEIANWGTDRAKRHRARNAQLLARILDSDLASMRSISPAAAHRIQIDRVTTRLEAESWSDLIWARDNDEW